MTLLRPPTPPPLPASSLVLLAHRGATEHHPENSLPALAAALAPAERADGLECDVRLAQDDQPYVFHDDDTERLTGVAGPFAAHPPLALAALRLADQSPIPTLAKAAHLVTAALPARDVLWNVELKPSPTPDALVAAVRPYLDPLVALPGLTLVVSTFDPRVLAAARRVRAPWRLAYLYETPAALTALAWLDAPDAIDLHPRWDLVDARHIAEYTRPGRAFRVWTVDDPREALRLHALGVSTLITNRTRALRDACTPHLPARPAP